MNNSISRLMAGAFLFLLCIACSIQSAGATEEYAKQTGKVCADCHLDPGGGGELTVTGKTFSATLHAKTEQPTGLNISKLFRLLIGYIHFVTAIFWFGTILYVHLVLKPAYAAGGLPRGELRVGIASMAIMGITGAILTCYRINSLDTLIHTRFGILLLAKISLYLVMVVSVIIVVTFIGPRLKAKMSKPRQPSSPPSGKLSPDDLALCDGKEGQPAYFAFEGTIYDATASALWKNGVHMGRHNAGTDLTEALKLAPHGPDKIFAMKNIGPLVAVGPRKLAPHERVFYFMAYMNLTIVLLIILILALWRWG